MIMIDGLKPYYVVSAQCLALNSIFQVLNYSHVTSYYNSQSSMICPFKGLVMSADMLHLMTVTMFIKFNGIVE